jgi:hypothetical protein
LTIKDQIEKDSVAVRWVRTAATTITAVAAAVGVIWGAMVYVFEPRAVDWTTRLVEGVVGDIRRNSEAASNSISKIDAAVERLAVVVEELSDAAVIDVSTAWRFSVPDTTISDGRIGDFVTIRTVGWKVRECGVPRFDIYFINGEGIYHRFNMVSALDPLNRGIPLRVDTQRPQEVSFRARIPANEGVHPGRANGFVSISYPEKCPRVDPVTVGPLQFRIVERI